MGKLTISFHFLKGMALTSLPAWFFVLFYFCLASQMSLWTFWISYEFVMYLVKLMLPRWSRSGLNRWIFFPFNLQNKKSGKSSSPHSVNLLKAKIHTHTNTHTTYMYTYTYTHAHAHTHRHMYRSKHIDSICRERTQRWCLSLTCRAKTFMFKDGVSSLAGLGYCGRLDNLNKGRESDLSWKKTPNLIPQRDLKALVPPCSFLRWETIF